MQRYQCQKITTSDKNICLQQIKTYEHTQFVDNNKELPSAEQNP